MQWLIDFDDTLVNGPVTYALKEVFPRFIRAHDLPYDPVQFDAEVLRCQEIASQTGNDAKILQELFHTMNWSHELQQTLLEDVFDNYTPSLFEDTRPFLQRLTQQGHTLYILSNNNHAPEFAAQLQIADFFAGIFTPKSCGLKQGKPHPEIWQALLQKGLFEDTQDVTIVGDDPWSEGLFAERCGLNCWILDRLRRFTTLYDSKPYSWAQRLDDIAS